MDLPGSEVTSPVDIPLLEIRDTAASGRGSFVCCGRAEGVAHLAEAVVLEVDAPVDRYGIVPALYVHRSPRWNLWRL